MGVLLSMRFTGQTTSPLDNELSRLFTLTSRMATHPAIRFMPLYADQPDNSLLKTHSQFSRGITQAHH